MGDHPSHDRLQEYVGGRLPEGERRAVADHANICPPCRDALAGLEEEAEVVKLRQLFLEADPALDRATDSEWPPGGPAESPLPPAVGETPGTRIGPYKLVEMLGEGGMGTVWKAEQDKPRRLVALKLLKPGTVTPKRLRRFEYEAELVGRLQHPNIAQVFEAGTADAGHGPQPFFAMELIEGRTLADHAQAHELNTRQRLALMVQVCQGVQHAHDKGVIHRDLKPANILVDAAGRPKVLDFGVARLTDSDDIHATRLSTDVGQLIGTIPYMSPEQAAAEPDDLTTRSDVYTLGVLCYQLLAGRLPHDLKGKGPLEAARTIREEAPTPLSAADRAFRGDLDTIVAKALEKDKERRYPSASHLADDINRYLADEPIVARRAGIVYRFRKFARRNKALVTAVLALAIGLVATTVVSILFAVEKLRHAESIDQAARERERVTQLARQQQELAGALEEIVHISFDLLALEVIAQEPQQRNPSPDVRTRFLQIEALKRSLGTRSLPTTLETAINALAQVEVSPQDPKFEQDSRILAYFCSVLGGQAQERGKSVEAERIFRLAVAAWELRLRVAPDDADAANELANCLYSQGMLARDRGRPAEQEAAWKRSASVSESIAGKNVEFAANLGRTYFNLGVLAGKSHRPDEVIAWQTKAIDTLTLLCRAAPERSDLAWFLAEACIGRGVAWHDKGDDPRALPDLNRAAELATGKRRNEIREYIIKELQKSKK